jgi:hypothetical protein
MQVWTCYIITMPSGGLVANHNRSQCITSTLGWRKFTVNSASRGGDGGGVRHAAGEPAPRPPGCRWACGGAVAARRWWAEEAKGGGSEIREIDRHKENKKVKNENSGIDILEWGIWRGMQNVGLEGKFGGVCKMQTRLEAMLELSFLHQTSKFRSRGPYRGPCWSCSKCQ